MKSMRPLSSVTSAYDLRTEPEAVRLLANMLWNTLLVAAVVLATTFLVFGVWLLLWSLGSFEAGTADIRQTAPTLDRQALHATLDELQARADRFEELTGASIKLVDPAR